MPYEVTAEVFVFGKLVSILAGLVLMTTLVPSALVPSALVPSALVPSALVPSAASAAPADDRSDRLEWGPCPEGGGKAGMQCAEFTVPVDPGEPQGRQLTLALGRLPADGSAPPRGSVLVNFGGPGAPGIQVLRERPEPFAKLRHRMHVVTWDTRGFPGRSTQLPCDWGRVPHRPVPETEAEFRRLAATNSGRASACRRQDPVLFDHMSSSDHAHDMEAIRRALGEDQLTYHGTSYGGMYGQAYARLFPSRVRAMFLDGIASHDDQAIETFARIGDRMFGRFIDWCESEQACALHDRNVEAAWRKLVARAEQKAIPAPKVNASFDDRDIRELVTVKARSGPKGWDELAVALEAALGGDASGLAVSPRSPYPGITTPAVTECTDWPRYGDAGAVAAAFTRARRVAPLTGGGTTMLNALLGCVGWPTPVTNPPAPLPDDLPPLLGAGTWLEYESTRRVTDQVPGSVTIRHDGPGHGLYVTGNQCVIAHADRYLLTGELPPGGTTCG